MPRHTPTLPSTPTNPIQQVVELLDRGSNILQMAGMTTPFNNIRTSASVRLTPLQQLKKDPVLWAAYSRGWEDRTADINRVLRSPLSMSRPRQTTRTRVPTLASQPRRARHGTQHARLTDPRIPNDRSVTAGHNFETGTRTQPPHPTTTRRSPPRDLSPPINMTCGVLKLPWTPKTKTFVRSTSPRPSTIEMMGNVPQTVEMWEPPIPGTELSQLPQQLSLPSTTKMAPPSHAYQYRSKCPSTLSSTSSSSSTTTPWKNSRQMRNDMKRKKFVPMNRSQQYRLNKKIYPQPMTQLLPQPAAYKPMDIDILVPETSATSGNSTQTNNPITTNDIQEDMEISLE